MQEHHSLAHLSAVSMQSHCTPGDHSSISPARAQIPKQPIMGRPPQHPQCRNNQNSRSHQNVPKCEQSQRLPQHTPAKPIGTVFVHLARQKPKMRPNPKTQTDDPEHDLTEITIKDSNAQKVVSETKTALLVKWVIARNHSSSYSADAGHCQT